MIIAAIVLAATSVVGVGTPEQERAMKEVFVKLSRQLSEGTSTTSGSGASLKCTLTKSTGDAELDEIFCETMRACGGLTVNGGQGGGCATRKTEELLIALAAKRTGVDLITVEETENAAEQ